MCVLQRFSADTREQGDIYLKNYAVGMQSYLWKRKEKLTCSQVKRRQCERSCGVGGVSHLRIQICNLDGGNSDKRRHV